MDPYRSDLETAHAKVVRLEATVRRLTEELARRDGGPAAPMRPSRSWRWVAFVAASCVVVIGVSLSLHAPSTRARTRADANQNAPSPSSIPPTHVVHTTERGRRVPLLLDEHALVWPGGGTIRMLDLASNEVRTLATNVEIAGAMAMNDTHVYWLSWQDDRVMRVSRDGGAPEVLAEIGERLATGMALTPTHVYWTELVGGVYRLSLEGGRVEDLGWGTSRPRSPEIRGNDLYVLAARREVRRLRIGPGPAIARASEWETIPMLEDANFLTDIVLDDTHVYGQSDNGAFVFRVPLDGGGAELVADHTQPLGLAVADGWVYMATTDGVARVPCAGGSVETIRPGHIIQAIAVGGGRVFWASGGAVDPEFGSIESMPVP